MVVIASQKDREGAETEALSTREAFTRIKERFEIKLPVFKNVETAPPAHVFSDKFFLENTDNPIIPPGQYSVHAMLYEESVTNMPGRPPIMEEQLMITIDKIEGEESVHYITFNINPKGVLGINAASYTDVVAGETFSKPNRTLGQPESVWRNADEYDDSRRFNELIFPLENLLNPETPGGQFKYNGQ